MGGGVSRVQRVGVKEGEIRSKPVWAYEVASIRGIDDKKSQVSCGKEPGENTGNAKLIPKN